MTIFSRGSGLARVVCLILGGLPLLTLSTVSVANATEVTTIYPSEDTWLRLVHAHRLAGAGKNVIRTTCTLIDVNVDFHGGCGWVLAWEQNFGQKLGDGLGFLKKSTLRLHF
jgi:hypothetical protein